MALLLFAASAVGLLALAAQLAALRSHLRRGQGVPGEQVPELRLRAAPRDGISVPKPLCGADDDLERNLETFARQDHPRYEVLLGLRDASDPAFPVARSAAARWPATFRVVLQRGERGLNPKVNPLVTLAAEARHDVLVVSDSNVRVAPGYLRDVVVGKSMAFRRRDLEALGGFESAKDVLAEDYALGLRVSRELGKRVAIGAAPVENVNQRRTVSAFLARYDRWCVMQRKIAGSPVYASQALLNPIALALAAALAAPGAASAAGLAAVCAAKAALDGAAARALRPGGFRPWQLALVPLKDLLFATSLVRGFLRSTVEWRGNRLRVLPGSRLALPGGGELGEPAGAAGAARGAGAAAADGAPAHRPIAA